MWKQQTIARFVHEVEKVTRPNYKNILNNNLSKRYGVILKSIKTFKYNEDNYYCQPASG